MRKFRTLQLAAGGCLVIISGACANESSIQGEELAQKTAALTFEEHESVCESDPRVIAGIVPLEVCVGAELFMRETFDGNGRTCASCHRAERNFAIDPEFIATLPDDDPLFVAEFDPALSELEHPDQMRERGLILENVDGTEPGGPSVRFVLRSVPHNLSMGTSIATPAGGATPPMERTGWSGDGAPGQGRLADFTNGAIGQHMTKSLDRVAGQDFRVATEEEGQAVALFMKELGRKNELNLDSVAFQDAGANEGKQRFMEVGCNGCHRNAGANTGSANTNRNFNTGVELARSDALASFPVDGGFSRLPENADGSFGDETFNSTPLIEAADTGPFFHTDTMVVGAPAHNTPSAVTIEEATAFYATPAFAAARGAALDIDAEDIDNIGRFLRAVNAVFNIQMSIKRVLGARTLINQFQNQALDVQNRMLVLARVELDDAVRVLEEAQGGPLNPSAQTRLAQARGFIQTALGSTSLNQRQQSLAEAFNRLDIADSEISANIQFDIGSGTLMD